MTVLDALALRPLRALRTIAAGLVLRPAELAQRVQQGAIVRQISSQGLLITGQAWARAQRALGAMVGDERGQAMAEYSLLTFGILAGTIVAGFSVKVPEFGNHSLAQAIYLALQTYVNGVNFSLSLAAT